MMRGGKIAVDSTSPFDTDVKATYADQLVPQQLKVLLQRGVHGLYLFAVDPELQAALERSAVASDRLDLDD